MLGVRESVATGSAMDGMNSTRRTWLKGMAATGLVTALPHGWLGAAEVLDPEVREIGSEMSIYATPFRRFVLRTDGFASVHAGADLGQMVTRPLRFWGRELSVN
jgi:hypothetical protein